MSSGWRFAYHASPTLPPLAWIAGVEGGIVSVRCGTSVRCEERGFIEGTWVGPPHIHAVPESTAVFGTGMFASGDKLIAVPPSHPLERIYLYAADGRVVVSNSLVAVLETCDLELEPDVLYPPIFVAAADGVRNATMDVPTNRGPLTTAVYYNFRVDPTAGIEVDGRPRERPFTSFEDFRERLTEALRSAVANAPDYEMAVSLSSGYDSTAVAAVAAEVGCREALSFREGKPVPGGESATDTGEQAARQLGMSIQTFDRLEYLDRHDLPEAEFLSTGMSAEDVVMTGMQPEIGRRILLTGAEEFRLKGGPRRSALYRGDLSSCSMTEFRLRTDFVHLPLLFFGASEKFSLIDITDSPAMQPWTLPGHCDKPIQRRLAEEGGVARGTFATVKRRASARIHTDGLAAMSRASAAAVAKFAGDEGRAVPSGQRAQIKRRHRLALRATKNLGMEWVTDSLARRRRSLIHAEPSLGSLLFRWSVSVVRPRYAAEPIEKSAPTTDPVADLTSSAGA